MADYVYTDATVWVPPEGTKISVTPSFALANGWLLSIGAHGANIHIILDTAQLRNLSAAIDAALSQKPAVECASQQAEKPEVA